MTKEERREYDKQYYEANKDKVKEYYQANKDKKREYDKQYHEANKEKKSKQKKQYYQANKEKLREYNKQWKLDNKDKIKEKRKKYREANKDKVKEQRKDRYHSDPLYKFKKICSNRTYIAFKANSWKKNGGTEKLLGCDYKTAMNHIESQFVDDKKWMNWDNHGEWHIDHNTPLASATTKEEMEKLCHYTNLQPLLAEENIRKSDKILN